MIRLILAAHAACLMLSPAHAHDGVHVEQAYAVVATPSAPTAAVYFVIENHAIDDDRLIAATSDVAKKALLHTTTQKEGIASMAPVPEGFVIEGQGTFVLERGASHIMLLGLTKPLTAGDTITLTLTFTRSGEVVVEVPVNPEGVVADDHFGHTMPIN